MQGLGESMRPRLRKIGECYDCGWLYELWECIGANMTVFGNSPTDAYNNWAELCLPTVNL